MHALRHVPWKYEHFYLTLISVFNSVQKSCSIIFVTHLKTLGCEKIHWFRPRFRRRHCRRRRHRPASRKPQLLGLGPTWRAAHSVGLSFSSTYPLCLRRRCVSKIHWVPSDRLDVESWSIPWLPPTFLADGCSLQLIGGKSFSESS